MKILSGLFKILITIIVPILGTLISYYWTPDYFTASDQTLRTPFAHQHLLTIIFLSVASVSSYWISRLFYTKLSPILKVISQIGMIQGLLLGLTITIQFLGFILRSTSGISISNISHSFSNGGPQSILLMSLFLIIQFIFLLCPVIISLLLFKELLRVHKIIQKEHPKNQSKLSDLTKHILLFFPFFVVEDLFLILFRQKVDSAILAFTQTCSWTLSQYPCNIVSGHYLCTAAAHGHKGLVRPLRLGLRGNTVITVNRQLLVANAFENWFEDHSPLFHKIIRKTYDKIGIPLYKMIYNVWLSDITYIFMKPLELFFVLWLYVFDPKPEDRIATQYLPKKSEGSLG